MVALSEVDLEGWTRAVSKQLDGSCDLPAWLEGPLREFFPYKGVVLAYGELVAGEVSVTHMLPCGHEPAYLEQLSTTFELKQRGCLKHWFETREPFYLDPMNPPPCASDFEVEEIRRFGLGNVAGHGVLNMKANAGTYFGFAGVEGPLGEWHCNALRLIAPYLNAWFLAYLGVKQSTESGIFSVLTERQKAIVRYVASGFNDKSIARHLAISEKTVRNQLADAYARIGIHKRTQLIALLK